MKFVFIEFRVNLTMLQCCNVPDSDSRGQQRSVGGILFTRWGEKYIAKQNNCEITSKCNFDHKCKRLNISLKDSTARETMWSTLEALQIHSNIFVNTSAFRLFLYSNLL